MQQHGEYEIAAPRLVVWEALNDPDVLGACIPGCQEVVRVDEQHFTARVKAKIGPVSSTFQTELELADLVPPESYTIVGGVKGGAAGFGKGRAQVRLEEVGADGEHTRLSYEVDASVGGKLAQVGSRLVDGAARKMADDFFGAFSARLAPPGDPAPGSGADDTDAAGGAGGGGATADQRPATATGAAAGGGKAAPVREKSGAKLTWVVAFVVLAIAMILAV